MTVWELMAVLAQHRSGTGVRIRTPGGGSEAIRIVRVEAIEGSTVLVVEPEDNFRSDKQKSATQDDV